MWLIIREANLEREVEIDLDLITFGRSKVNSVILNNTGASPRHCALEKTQQGWFLVDLGSDAGTLLDGKYVRKAPIAVGSVISIGASRIHFTPEGGVKRLPKEYRPTKKPRWMRKALSILASAAACLLLLHLAAYIIFSGAVEEKRLQDIQFHREPFDNYSSTRGGRWGRLFWHPRFDRLEPVLMDETVHLEDAFTPAIEIPIGTSFDMLAKKRWCPYRDPEGYYRYLPLQLSIRADWHSRSPRHRVLDWGGWGNRGSRRISPRVEAAIAAALDWLARHQDRDGKWDQDGFNKNCATERDKRCDGRGTSQFDVGVTSLALLAFMAAGHTHRLGPCRKTVRMGLKWLQTQQNKDGSLGPRLADSWVYNHAIGTLALCEAYAMTRDYRLKKPCRRAVDFILNAQNPKWGWKYKPRSGRSDTSVTGWMVLALRAAKGAGIEVPTSAFDGAVNWFGRMTNAAGKVGYMRPGDDGTVIRHISEHYEKLPAMTAEATICRMLCGMSRRDPKVLKGVDMLMGNLPDWNRPRNDKVDMYYWFWATHAMHQYGGQNWHKWQTAIKKALCDTQRFAKTCADGSWDPIGKWGMVGGRVYSTAINCLTLETCYLNRASRTLIWRRH